MQASVLLQFLQLKIYLSSKMQPKSKDLVNYWTRRANIAKRFKYVFDLYLHRLTSFTFCHVSIIRVKTVTEFVKLKIEN